MSEATTISIDVFEALLLEGKKSGITEKADKFETRTLVWLALPPFWQQSLAEKGFPKNEEQFAKGDEARSLLKLLVKSNFAETDVTGKTDDSVSYWMKPLQRKSLIEQVTSGELTTDNFTGLDYLRRETAEIGRRILSLSEKDERLPALQRWASLAELAQNPYDLSDFFSLQIKEALQAARAGEQKAAPEVLRWLEAFAPFVELFGSSLEIALTSARREYEIFNRQAYDRRYLSSYLVRDEQDAALLELLNQPDDADAPWALHYVGAGGVGKTMLMRHINAHLSQQHNLAIARIDFDYLNPDYPAKQPGLLLLGFAVDLKKYITDWEGVSRFEKQIREIHNNLQSSFNTEDFIDLQSGRWSYIIESFVDELRSLPLGMRPLLILDTCEELVKLRPDGTLPQSVHVTFHILKEIHRRLPSVRVVFSGRRALAREGYGWHLRENDKYLNRLEKRNYLMLQEIRGFTHNEATDFLSSYKTGKVPEKLFDAILARSRNSLTENAQTLVFEKSESGNGAQQTVRYNPFDLDLYADWAVSEPNLDERKLLAGEHFYVKERIVGRVNARLKKILPALLLLGRFDETMLRRFYGKDAPDFNPLFEELIDQEWIDTEHGTRIFETTVEKGDGVDADGSHALPVWVIDPNMRERLLSYYRAEGFNELSAARELVAPLLLHTTLERDWHELSIAYFEAAVCVLTELDKFSPQQTDGVFKSNQKTFVASFVVLHQNENKESAADWWSMVEAKLADSARWDWAYALTSQLLATGGVAELKELRRSIPDNPTEIENVLRPAILATHAAALIHTDPSKVRDIWQEVKEKAHFHPTNSGKTRLTNRATFGIFAADAADAVTTQDIEKILHDFGQALANIYLSDDESLRNLQMQASIFSAFEKIVEACERFAPDVGKIDKAFLPNIYFSKTNICDLWAANLPDDLFRYYQVLAKKLRFLLIGEFEFSFWSEDTEFSPPKNKQEWLDWRAPDDLDARLKLENLRGMYSRSENAAALLKEIADAPKNFNNIDADRLAAAILTLKWYVGSDDDLDINDENIDASLSLAKKTTANSQTVNEAFFVNAHRAFPPYFIAALEIRAMSGKLSETIKKIVLISEEAERNQNFNIRQETERLLARLAFHFRLRDERSIRFGESLTSSENPEDVRLRSMLDALDGGILEQNYWQNLVAKAGKENQAALLHFRYRSSRQLFDPKIIEKDTRLVINSDTSSANSFESLIVFDEVEYQLRKKGKISLTQSRLSELLKLNHTDFAFHNLLESIDKEVSMKVENNLETIEFRNMSETENHSLKEVIHLTGTRRAAAITLEEGMLLTIRNPKIALRTLRRAARLYIECNDACGEFLARLTIALHAINTKDRKSLQTALSDLKSAYNKLVGIESGLPSLNDLLGYVNDAQESVDPAEVFTNFFDKYEKDLYWRPILVRMIFCFVRIRDFDGQSSLTLSLKMWLQKNYSRTTGSSANDPVLFPPEFDFADQNAVNSNQKTEYASQFKKYLFIALIACLYVGSFYIGISESDYLISTFFGITGCLFLVWWWFLFKLNIFVNTTEIPSDSNLPLSVSHQIRCFSDKGIQWLSGFVVKETARIDQARDSNYSGLAAIFSKWLRRFLAIAKIRLNLLPTTLIFDSFNSVAAPWEAALGFNQKGFHKTRFMFRRMLKKSYPPRNEIMFSPIGICNLAAEIALLDLTYKGWSPLAVQSNIQYTGIIPSSLNITKNKKNVFVLHLVGLPIETPSGVRLEIVASEAESQLMSGTTAAPKATKERIISAEKINREFPNLRVCVVQLPPRSEAPRSLTSKLEIAKLRRFCADIFGSGIGAVILLPSVTSEQSVECVQKLAGLILNINQRQANSERFLVQLTELSSWMLQKLSAFVGIVTIVIGFLLCSGVGAIIIILFIILAASVFLLDSPRVHRLIERGKRTNLKDWMRAVYDVQKLIAAGEYSNAEAPLELPYDVCLYLHDDFTWRIY